jgi:hypothetical protein
MAVGYSDIIGDSLEEGMLFNVSLLVADVGMTMRESPPLYVLSRYSHTVALVKESSPR